MVVTIYSDKLKSGIMKSKLKVSLLDCGSSRTEINEPLALELLEGSLERELGDRTHLDISLQSEVLKPFDLDDVGSQTDIVGISTKLGSINSVRRIIEHYSAFPSPPVIVFGNLLSTFAFNEMLDTFPDGLVVKGEGEDAIVGIAESILNIPSGNQYFRKELARRDVPNLAFILDGKKFETTRKIVDLNKVALPNRYFLPEVIGKRGIVRAEGSRGCPWSRCSYCAISAKYDYVGWRSFPLDYMITELETISNMGGMHPYYTDEDFFGGDRSRVLELAERILEAKREGRINPDLTLYVDARVNTILGVKQGGLEQSIPMLQKLKDAGLREVFLGIESGSKKQMKRYGKGAVTNYNVKALEVLRNLGISVDIGFIMFDAESTLDDLKYNVAFIYSTQIQNHDSRLTKKVRVQPYTGLHKQMMEKGILTDQLEVNSLTYPYEFQDRGVAEVYKSFKLWESETENFVYMLQAACRGEVKDERIRKYRRNALGEFRFLDLEYLSACIGMAEQRSSSFQKQMAIIKPSFESRRNSLIEKYKPIIIELQERCN